jgi:hypothetical protein
MMLSNPSRFMVIAGGMTAMLVAGCVALWLETSPVFMPLGKQAYRVVSVEHFAGTNVTPALDSRLKEWGRRQLDKIGFHLVGSRGDHFLLSSGQPEGWHTVAVLCQGEYMTSAQMLREIGEDMYSLVAECIDEQKSAPLKPFGHHQGPPGHVWFIWKYHDSDVFEPYQNRKAIPAPATFQPTHLLLMRKVGEKELIKVPMPQ